MKYLILKDIVVQRMQIVLITLLLIGLTFIWYLSGSGIALIYLFGSLMISLSLVTGSLSYDDEDGVSLFLLTLPVKRKTIVLAKYLVSFVMVLLGILITFIQVEILNIIFGNPLLPPWSMIFGSLIGNLTITALMLGVFYKFGYRAIRFIMVGSIVLAVFCSLIYTQSVIVNRLLSQLFLISPPILIFIMSALAGVIYLASLYFSLNAIEKD